MSVLGLLRDEGPAGWIIFVLFFVLPLLARLVRWVLKQAGVLKDEAETVAQTSDERRRARVKRREAEREGEDLFRRLARGDLAEAPPAPPPAAPRPVFVPAPVESREESLELEVEPTPLSVLGEVSEPGEAAETSLEREEAPVPLEALTSPAVALEEATARRAGFVLGRADLRRAMILTEILGPPVAERQLRA